MYLYMSHVCIALEQTKALHCESKSWSGDSGRWFIDVIFKLGLDKKFQYLREREHLSWL